MAMPPEATGSSRPAVNTPLSQAAHLATDAGAFGRHITRTGATPMGQQDCLSPETPATPDHAAGRPGTAPTGALPPELLSLIFDYLAPSTHNQCALVCRRWCACLPGIRGRLVQWVAQSDPEPLGTASQLVPAYSSRTRPWLAAHQSALLPVLERQHEEWQRLHKLPASPVIQQQEQQAHRALGRLLLFSLHHQIIQTQQLHLQPVAIDWQHTDRLSVCSFSTCSRWMALLYEQGTSTGLLRLYGWRNDSWRVETLLPPQTAPISLLCFSEMMEDTLIAIHGRELVYWQREAGTSTWLRTQLWELPGGYLPEYLDAMPNDDLIVLSRERGGGMAALLLLFACQDRESGWAAPTQHFYVQRPHFIALTALSCQFALAVIKPQCDDEDSYRNEIHIWHKEPGCAPPGAQEWLCRVSHFVTRMAAVRSMYFVPASHLLLTLLTDKRACLWTLDAEHRLQEQLTVQLEIDQEEQWMGDEVAVRSDGKQLALPCSMEKIQLCDKDRDGRWQCGDIIETSAAFPDESLRTVLLAADKRTLVWLTDRQVVIWQKDTHNRWEKQLQRTTQNAAAPAPQACLLGIGHAVCTTAADPENTLCIHAPDADEQLVSKAMTPIEARVVFKSPDGLSLMLHSGTTPPFILQLMRQPDSKQ
ncbi:MAG: F-box protein [Kistimonas sp.]|nr:F-box protein [Kistimonas sp.]